MSLVERQQKNNFRPLSIILDSFAKDRVIIRKGFEIVQTILNSQDSNIVNYRSRL